MDTFVLSCPNCDFSKDMPLDKLPKKPSSVTCPKCKTVFTFNPDSISNNVDFEFNDNVLPVSLKTECPYCKKVIDKNADKCCHCESDLTKKIPVDSDSAMKLQTDASMSMGGNKIDSPEILNANISKTAVPNPTGFQKPKNPVLSALKWIGIVFGGMFVLIMVIGGLANRGKSPSNDTTTTASGVEVTNEMRWDKYETELTNAQISDINPDVLRDMFGFGSKYTNVQRENAQKEIIGKYVQWTLPIYEIRRRTKYYTVTTNSPPALLSEIQLYPRNQQEVQLIESLQTGNTITIRAKISGIGSMRSVDLDPAMLWNVEAAQKNGPQPPDPAYIVRSDSEPTPPPAPEPTTAEQEPFPPNDAK